MRPSTEEENPPKEVEKDAQNVEATTEDAGSLPSLSSISVSAGSRDYDTFQPTEFTPWPIFEIGGLLELDDFSRQSRTRDTELIAADKHGQPKSFFVNGAWLLETCKVFPEAVLDVEPPRRIELSNVDADDFLLFLRAVGPLGHWVQVTAKNVCTLARLSYQFKAFHLHGICERVMKREISLVPGVIELFEFLAPGDLGHPFLYNFLLNFIATKSNYNIDLLHVAEEVKQMMRVMRHQQPINVYQTADRTLRLLAQSQKVPMNLTPLNVMKRSAVDASLQAPKEEQRHQRPPLGWGYILPDTKDNNNVQIHKTRSAVKYSVATPEQLKELTAKKPKLEETICKPFKKECEHCGLVYYTKRGFEGHIEHEHPQTLQCQQCGEMFTTIQLLCNHTCLKLCATQPSMEPVKGNDQEAVEGENALMCDL